MNAAPAHLDDQHPWPGLAAFTEDDRAYFRGREREADELARLVRRERLTVLFGRSGLGKTSLLGAGLFPRLRKDDHLPVLLRIGYDAGVSAREQVWRALAAAAAAAGVEMPLPHGDPSLWEYFHRAGAAFWSARNRPVTPVLVFDQFEELFTVGESGEAARTAGASFVDELACLVEDRIPEDLRAQLDADPARSEGIDFGRRGCRVVLSFREDFLADVEGLRDRMPSLARNRFRLLPMNGLQAREVVAAGGALVDDEAGARIIGLAWRNRAEAPAAADYERIEIDPALLSVICSELNLRRMAAGGAHIEPALVAGAEREILGHFYERSFEGLDTRLRAFVEDELITEAGFRDSFAYDDALSRPGVTRDALQRLIGGRLLRVDERFGVRRLELTHDVLTRVVRESRDARKAREAEAAAAELERRALARQRRNRLVAAWIAAAGALALALLVGAGIAIRYWIDERAQAIALREDIAKAQQALTTQSEMTAAAMQRASEAERVSQTEASRAEAAMVGVKAARRQAESVSRDAQLKDLMTNARSLANSQPDIALLLGAEAIRRDDTRLDALVGQLSRLIANDGVHALLRVDAGVSALAVRADGRRALLGAENGELLELDLVAWRVLHRWRGHERSVTAVAYLGDGSRVVSADYTGLAAWQVVTGRELARAELSGQLRGARRLLGSPDGNVVVVESASDQLALWSPAAARQPLRIGGPTDGTCLAFDARGQELQYVHGGRRVTWRLADDTRSEAPDDTEGLIARSADCGTDAVARRAAPERPITIELRNGASGELLGPPSEREDLDFAARFDATGRAFMLRGKTSVELWSTRPPRRVAEIEHGGQRVQRISVSRDGRWIAVALGKGDFVVHSVDGGEPRVKGRLEGVQDFLFAPDGGAVVPIGRSATVLRVHPLGAPTGLQLDGRLHVAEEVEFTRSGSMLATVAKDSSSAHFWDANGRHLRRETIQRAEFSPDGSRLVLVRHGGGIEILPVHGGEPQKVAPPDGSSVQGIAISRDNQRLAIALHDGRIVMHDLAGRRQTTFTMPTQLRAIALHPDGRTLAAGGGGGVVRLLRWGESTVRALRQVHSGDVLRLSFSPDGGRLASGGADGVAIVHDVASGEPIARFSPHDDNLVNSVVFVEPGDVLVSGTAKGSRLVWDLRTGARLARLRDSGATVTSVDISPSGRRVAILHNDGSVALRNWDAATLQAQACALVNRNLDCGEWRQYLPEEPYELTCPAQPAPKSACR